MTIEKITQELQEIGTPIWQAKEFATAFVMYKTNGKTHQAAVKLANKAVQKLHTFKCKPVEY